MKKMAHLAFGMLFCFQIAAAQETTANDPDTPYKLGLYAKYKNEVLRYSHKDFDAYFMDYFEKLGQPQPLTREEFYTYTVKIAIYSEKLGLLYKDRLDESKKTREEWFNKKYSDYLSTRQPKNK